MQNLLAPTDLKLANRFRRLWSLYQQNVDLIQVGAYQPGSNAEIDQAIALRAAMETFLRQDMYTGIEESQTRADVRMLMEQ
jgi:flagellum-specific ATP synthase